jgi:MoxR-like ATPase
METATQPSIDEIFTLARDLRAKLFAELGKAIIGQRAILHEISLALLAQGHVLITGVPGLGKTLLVKSLAQSLSLSFKRIQFTPDLMPADICGAEVADEDPHTGRRQFRFIEGPVFANVVLADEVNRTPPKTQAALLEAMGENQVTVSGRTMPLQAPFFVLATQNPIELEGTYPLPEAQLDRFLLNVVMDYLPEDEEVAMVAATTAPRTGAPAAVLSREEVLRLQSWVRLVPVAEPVVRYAVRLAAATRPGNPQAPELVRARVKWGAGSRASQALIMAGKANALLDGRANVAIEDVRALALPALRHRIIPNFHAEAEGLSADNIIREVIAQVRA